jgi:hypothetical protein
MLGRSSIDRRASNEGTTEQTTRPDRTCRIITNQPALHASTPATHGIAAMMRVFRGRRNLLLVWFIHGEEP